MNNVEWIKLVEFGNYHHCKGLQVVDRESAEEMIEYFRSLRGRFMRKFLGLPIYIGHPDDPEYSGPHDKTIYGRIENLKIENDALWMLSRWSSIGKKIFGNKFLRYLSPRWMMKKLSDRIFSPVRLLSVGLTNHPNVRCEHTVAQINENINEQLSQHVCSEKVADVSSYEDDGCDSPQSDETDVTAPKPKPHTEDCTQQSGTSSGLEYVEVDTRWHTCSLTDHLTERRKEVSIRDKILLMVHEHMLRTGDDYQSSWMTIKRQNPGLFQ